MYEPGNVGVGLRPGLFALYGIDGEFVAETPAKGTLEQSDSGDFVARFGAAARAELVLRDDLLIALGIDYRLYDIDGLNPIQELDISVDEVDSLQYYLALRYLLPAFESQPRLRPFAQATVAYLPSVDIGFEIDLSNFGSSNLRIDTEGEGYWVGGASVGLLYQWTDHLVAELGLLYEVPITELDADLSFSIGPSEVPMFAELKPQGLLGFGGLTWYF